MWCNQKKNEGKIATRCWVWRTGDQERPGTSQDVNSLGAGQVHRNPAL